MNVAWLIILAGENEFAYVILETVAQKYPLTPRLAFQKAKAAANQAGRERLSVIRNSATAELTNELEIQNSRTPDNSGSRDEQD